MLSVLQLKGKKTPKPNTSFLELQLRMCQSMS